MSTLNKQSICCKSLLYLLFSAIFLFTSNDLDAQFGKLKKAKDAVTSKTKKSPCASSQKNLTKSLAKLKKLKEEDKVAKGAFKTTLKSADRHMANIKKRCPDENMSKEEKSLVSYKSDYESSDGSDASRKAAIRKGYFDESIKTLIPSTHPTYNDFRGARSSLTYAFEHYRHGKPTPSQQSLGEAKEAFVALKTNASDIDFSVVFSEIDRLQTMLTEEHGGEIANTLNKEGDRDYFRNLFSGLHNIYSNTDHGASVADGLGSYTNDNIYGTAQKYKDFSVDDFYLRIEAAKKGGSYPSIQMYAEKFTAALEDYPNFINKSNGTFMQYLDYMKNIGIKGDPQQELEQLKRAQTFCQVLLIFAPGNAKASQWKIQVESEISKRKDSMVFDSEMHRNHMGELLFSSKQVAIGNEKETDFSTAFKSGEFIYATVYLPVKVRKLTDSYAANDVRIKVNGSIISEASSTAVWVTTPMQEKNHLQFAILPDADWLKKNGSLYVENKLRTHEHIANALLSAGPYSGIEVEVRITFRGTNSSFIGVFEIDQSGGVDHLEKAVALTSDSRLADAKLPAAGMSNSNLEKQAMDIMVKKAAGNGQKYSKAIITSNAWTIDRGWNNVVLSRSIVVALVSKNHDGKCMYQYFNFTQAENGSGKFSSLLQYDGAGDNVYISCDNR